MEKNVFIYSHVLFILKVNYIKNLTKSLYSFGIFIYFMLDIINIIKYFIFEYY